MNQHNIQSYCKIHRKPKKDIYRNNRRSLRNTKGTHAKYHLMIESMQVAQYSQKYIYWISKPKYTKSNMENKEKKYNSLLQYHKIMWPLPRGENSKNHFSRKSRQIRSNFQMQRCKTNSYYTTYYQKNK